MIIQITDSIMKKLLDMVKEINSLISNVVKETTRIHRERERVVREKERKREGGKEEWIIGGSASERPDDRGTERETG